jgi:hypothetical protein
VATRTDSDNSHYFGADPSIDIDKTTSDDYGNEGDYIGIIPGEEVTWNYYITNTGNVTLTDVELVDDQLGPIGIIGTFNPGELVTFIATSTTQAGMYENTGTTSCTYTDDLGNSLTFAESDDSAYFGLDGGYLTSSSLCEFGDYFKLGFTPDMQNWPGHYRLSSINPGQFYYNLFYIGDGEPLEVNIPYPFITQGAVPVHVYGGVFVSEGSNGLYFTPSGELMSLPLKVSMDDQDPQDGAMLTITDLPEDDFIYVTIHLDFGLKKTNSWVKGKNSDALSDPDFNPNYPDILNETEFIFDSSIVDSNDSIINSNSFKNLKGFGGLVLDEFGGGVQGEEVSLYDSEGVLIETMITDENGWYWSDYRHKGKTADYTLEWNGESITVTVGGKIKFGEGIFPITP